MKDRAFLIRQAVKNGITDIGSIKEAWEHRFDGEENQTVEDTPWYQKMLNFLGETASMRRDARTGNVGATIVRDLYDSGNKEKADELSSQILAANLAGMALATGAAAVPASAVPTTGMEAVKLLSSVNIPAKQKLAQTAVNVLGSLVGGESINRTSQAFGYEGFGDAAYSTIMSNKTNRTPVDNVLISALDAFNPGYYIGIPGIKSIKGLKNTNATKSKKSKLAPDEKFKKALANYTDGADYVFYDPVKLRQRLRTEGVSPELLTDDNLKNLIHNRATSLEHINSVPKFAIRQPYGPGYQYNLYYANNNPTNVGYIEITPGHVGMTPANRINMVRNSSGWMSRTPVKGVSETAYNAVINDLGSVVSGENLQSAHITEKVLAKFNKKKVLNNHGFWTRDGKLTVGNPVYELTTPTFDVPTGYEDDFSLEAFDDSGHFINNISRGPIYKNGGKTNTMAETEEHRFDGNSNGIGGFFTTVKEKLRKLDERIWGPRAYRASTPSVVIHKEEMPYFKRVRPNDSKTSEKSTTIENGIANHQKSMYTQARKKGHDSSEYFIPYIEDQEITVPGVGRVTKNMLDSLAVNSYRAGIPWEEGLGLAFVETKGGAAPNMSTPAYIKNFTKQHGVPPTKEEIKQNERAMLNSSYARNFGGIHPQFLINDHEWTIRGWEESNLYKNMLHDIKSPLEHGFTMYKHGIYNAGNPYHTSEVKKEARRIKSLPIIQEWAKNSPYVKK